ncbi:PstS family phosphate ABC transporter substrate-binding protein [Paenibacillus rigui]|uniref:Phosphate-binding protein n=1 Tax=Paenibacillus rigui TaxID=554312 RepID=A0A229UR96_9BACL|nr:substrate-binding domain-containing protein [Paenibacillus rigui]OXM86016.1 phosphate-binding protein [Paenibacillus rigui]
METERPGRSKAMEGLIAVVWGIAFIIVYFLFNIFWGQTIASKTGLLLHLEWSDLTLAFAAAIYVCLVGLLFYLYGLLFSEKVAGRGMQLLTVLPLVLLGSLIWLLTYRSLSGATSNLNDMPWMFFTLFAFWLVPIVDYLKFYITDSTYLKAAGLLLSLLPSTAAWLGMIRMTGLQGERRLLRGLLPGTAVPAMLLALLFGSMLLPHQAPFTLKTLPVLDGATAAIPFGNIAVHELTGVNKPYAANAVRFNTTHNAYVNLIEKRADLIFVAGPSDEETALAASKGVKLKLTPIGKDAFIFLVHRENPVSNVTVAQLQAIYSGQLTNWKEIGGADSRIVAFQREKNSGSQTFMEQKIMKGLPFAEPPKERKAGGMGGLIEAVADYHNADNALGYSFYYYASEMNRREEVKFLAVEGVEPNKDNIRSKTYPFTAELFAVTREDEPENSAANRMVAWILSEEGRQAVEAGGYVTATH